MCPLPAGNPLKDTNQCSQPWWRPGCQSHQGNHCGGDFGALPRGCVPNCIATYTCTACYSGGNRRLFSNQQGEYGTRWWAAECGHRPTLRGPEMRSGTVRGIGNQLPSCELGLGTDLRFLFRVQRRYGWRGAQCRYQRWALVVQINEATH